MARRKDGDLLPLTGRQQAFAEAMAKHGDCVQAAKDAGYAHPVAHGNKIAKIPAVAESVRRIQARKLQNDLLPLAVGRLERILTDDQHKAADHISAAKVVLSYTLGKDAPGQDKAPEDMTADELAARMAALRARQVELADSAKVIEHEPQGDVFG